MKINLKYKIFIAIFIALIFPNISMANEELVLPSYTEEYKQWLELSDEEKANTIEPQAYETKTEEVQIYSVDLNEVGASILPSKYKRPYFGQVKDQGSTNACWAFSAATMFDTNYYITNSTKKQFANYHMDYITAKDYNPNGFNRKADAGSNVQVALAYATNGMGIALEKDMPTSGISTNSIANVPIDSKVKDYIEVIGQNQIKNYIYNYGVISAYTYIGAYGEYFSSGQFFQNSDLAYCCTDESEIPNHAITLVGWDDNYTNSAFPGKRGAYVVLNSYGTGFGNNGLYYIFYDDNIIKNSILYGVTETVDIEYDYLYQHDTYGRTADCGYEEQTYAANVFTRQNTNYIEKLTEISSYFPQAGEVTVYINSNGSDVKTKSAIKVMTTFISEPGYYTIELDEEIILQGSKFVVGIKYPGYMSAEMPTSGGWCSTVTSNANESYISYDGINYEDMHILFKNHGYNYSNACIKAFTKKESMPQYYNVNITKNISEAGSVTGNTQIQGGKKITLVASPNKNYRFVGWYNGNTLLSSNQRYELTVTSNMNIIAKFEGYGDLEAHVFDYKYYADHNLDLYDLYNYDEPSLRRHWVHYGKAEGRKSSAIFDVKYYVENNGDLAMYKNDYVGAYNHFMNYGYAEYRKSSLQYDGKYYRDNNKDLSNMTSMELIRHYCSFGKKELRQASTNYDITSLLFDPGIYAEMNPDVIAALGSRERDLQNHWYKYGIAEGRVASLAFDAKYYLKKYKDLANVYGSQGYYGAYVHFTTYGFAEGRQGSKVFSTKYYLEKNSDLKSKFQSNYLKALNYFITQGKKEARLTSPEFSIIAYRVKNSDLRNAFKESYERYFWHYLKYGQKEKRECI